MSVATEIPYGAYWSTPFAKWQGTLSHLHSIKFAAYVAKEEMAKRAIDPADLDYGILGVTVPQHMSFQGLPWLTGMIGAPHVTGPTLSQVCATGARHAKRAVERLSWVACFLRISEPSGGHGNHGIGDWGPIEDKVNVNPRRVYPRTYIVLRGRWVYEFNLQR